MANNSKDNTRSMSPTEQLNENTTQILAIKKALSVIIQKYKDIQQQIDSLNGMTDLSIFDTTSSNVDTSHIEKQINTIIGDIASLQSELNGVSSSLRHEINHLSNLFERIATVISPDTQSTIISMKTEMTNIKGFMDKTNEELTTFRNNFNTQTSQNLMTANEITSIRSIIEGINCRLNDNDAKTAELFSYRTTMRHVGQTILALAAILGTAWAIYSSTSAP